MKILQVQYEMQLAFDAPVTDHYFQFRCLPMEGGGQTAEELQVTVEPAGAVYQRTDGFGNRMCYGEALAAHDALRLRMSARVRVDREAGLRKIGVKPVGPAATDTAGSEPAAPVQAEAAGARGQKAGAVQLHAAGFSTFPDSPAGEVPGIVYVYPSGLTRPDEAMREWLCSLREKYDHRRMIFPEFLMHELHRRLSYARGRTHVGTTAAAAFGLGEGVCQDYAHIYVALCRMAGFPARYAAGMVVGEGATHAWAEVWQNGIWLPFDPTCDCLADDRYIKLSHGRDFGDCSVDRGCFRGGAKQRQTVRVRVDDITEA